jgi:hypothetical protein
MSRDAEEALCDKLKNNSISIQFDESTDFLLSLIIFSTHGPGGVPPPLNKHRKDKQLNNKHRLNIYKEEKKTPPRPPRAAIYPTFR